MVGQIADFLSARPIGGDLDHLAARRCRNNQQVGLGIEHDGAPDLFPTSKSNMRYPTQTGLDTAEMMGTSGKASRQRWE